MAQRVTESGVSVQLYRCSWLQERPRPGPHGIALAAKDYIEHYEDFDRMDQAIAREMEVSARADCLNAYSYPVVIFE